MNKTRRKKIKTAIINLKGIAKYYWIESVELLKNEIEDILLEEEEAYDNMPENLQYSMRGYESSDAVDNLQDAVDALEEAIDIIDKIENSDNKNEEKRLRKNEINNYIIESIDYLSQIV